MGFFLSKVFWGGFLISWGLVLIIEKIFKVNIPLGRFIIAFLLIYGGVYILTRTTKQKRVEINSNITTNSSVLNSSNGREFHSVFSSNIIDISDLSTTDPIEINSIFGSTTVYLSNEKTYLIRVNTAFGGTRLPYQNESWLGSSSYIIGDKTREQKINIEINTVFGSTNVMIKKSENSTDNMDNN